MFLGIILIASPCWCTLLAGIPGIIAAILSFMVLRGCRNRVMVQDIQAVIDRRMDEIINITREFAKGCQGSILAATSAMPILIPIVPDPIIPAVAGSSKYRKFWHKATHTNPRDTSFRVI
jgi:hypothetical protein